MNLVISIVIGAVIGYITNWLAIKMLFRPYTEKRIGRFKLPFTPGLIPKERDRIAKSVGDTVGRHLVTGENMMEAMESQEMKSYLHDIFIKKVETARESNKNIKTLGQELLEEKYETFTYSIKEKSSTYLIDKISSEDMIDKVTKEIQLVLQDMLKVSPVDVFNKLPIKDILDKTLKSEALKNDIGNVLNYGIDSLGQEGKTLNDIIPKGFFQGIEVYTYNERNEISFYLRRLLRQEEAANKIKDIIEKNVISNMNPLVSMFMSTESLYAKFTTIVDDYLNKEENKQEIAMIIGNMIKSFGNKEISSMVQGIPQHAKDEIIKDLQKKIVDLLNGEEFTNKIINFTSGKLEKFTTIDELLTFFNPDYESKISIEVKGAIKALVNSESLKEKVQEIIDELVVSVENKRLKEVMPEGNNESLDAVFNKLQELAGNLLKSSGGDFIEKLNIAKIVEKQIMSFPVEYAEELIIEIANKELKAITWLGALLGGIMGILAPVLSTLFK